MGTCIRAPAHLSVREDGILLRADRNFHDGLEPAGTAALGSNNSAGRAVQVGPDPVLLRHPPRKAAGLAGRMQAMRVRLRVRAGEALRGASATHSSSSPSLSLPALSSSLQLTPSIPELASARPSGRGSRVTPAEAPASEACARLLAGPPPSSSARLRLLHPPPPPASGSHPSPLGGLPSSTSLSLGCGGQSGPAKARTHSTARSRVRAESKTCGGGSIAAARVGVGAGHGTHTRGDDRAR